MIRLYRQGGAESSKAASKAGSGTKVQVPTQMRDGSEAQADGGGAESSKAASKAGLVEEAFDPPSPTVSIHPRLLCAA